MVSGHEIETKSERREQLIQFDLLAAAGRHFGCREIGVIGQHVHAQQAPAEFGDAAADIAKPDDADGLALRLGADQGVAVHVGIAPQRTIRLDDPLGQSQQHSERVLGHGMGIAAGLVDHHDARFGTGIDVDRIKAGAIA